MNRRFWIWTLVLSLTVALTVMLWRCCPRTVPLSQCSEVYQRYHDVPGIQAAFIKNKRINDTTTADMTLLTATDSAGWEFLKKTFDIKELPSELMKQLMIDETGIAIKLFPKDHPGAPMDAIFENNDAAAISREKHTVCIFHIISSEQYNSIVYKNVYDLNTQENEKSN